MNEQGFLKVNRGYFKGFLWKENRTFSKAEAWLDLMASARYETTVELINGRMTEVRRGEVPISRRYLEERWKWGSTKVLNFLEMLSVQGLINQRQDHKQTILFICECGGYEDEQTNDKPVTNQSQTNDKPVTNQPKDDSCDNVIEKTNQPIKQKQTMPINCNIVDCNERQTNNKPQNKPVTNQSQTNDKPVTNEKLPEERPETNQIKEIRIKNKENINNTPFIPPGGIIPCGGDEMIMDSFLKEKSSAKKERVTFVAPSVEAVAAYCKENGYTVSAWKFVNYYTSNGWMVGKNKMKDWQAAVRTWQLKESENGKKQLPATYTNNPGGGINNTARANAADKRAELGNLKHLAGAVLRGTKPQNG